MLARVSRQVGWFRREKNEGRSVGKGDAPSSKNVDVRVTRYGAADSLMVFVILLLLVPQAN